MSKLDPILTRLDPEAGILIGGQWRRGSRSFDVDNPADKTVVARVADGDKTQALAAVSAAVAAAAGWRDTSPRSRSEILYRTFEAMRRDADEFVALICAENGKSEADARAEVGYAAEFFRWFAEEAVRTGGQYGEAPGRRGAHCRHSSSSWRRGAHHAVELSGSHGNAQARASARGGLHGRSQARCRDAPDGAGGGSRTRSRGTPRRCCERRAHH